MTSPRAFYFGVLTMCAALCLMGCAGSDSADSGSLRTAVHLLLDGKHVEALSVCDAILEESPEHFDAHLLRGEICEAMRQFDEAEISYERALELQPTSEQAQLCLNRFRPSEAKPALIQPALVEPALSGDPAGQLIAEVDRKISNLLGTNAEASSKGSANDALPPDEQPNELDPRLDASDDLLLPSHQHRMLDAISQARRRDEKDREKRRESEVDELLASRESASADSQITRFDLSLSTGPTSQNVLPRTTGHSMAMTESSQGNRAPVLSNKDTFRIKPQRNWAEAAIRAAKRC